MRDMIQDELKRKYEKLGFDEEWVVKKILKAGQVAEANEDPLNMLRAAQEGKELLGMTPGTIKAERKETIESRPRLLERSQSYQGTLGPGKDSDD